MKAVVGKPLEICGGDDLSAATGDKGGGEVVDTGRQLELQGMVVVHGQGGQVSIQLISS